MAKQITANHNGDVVVADGSDTTTYTIDDDNNVLTDGDVYVNRYLQRAENSENVLQVSGTLLETIRLANKRAMQRQRDQDAAKPAPLMHDKATVSSDDGDAA